MSKTNTKNNSTEKETENFTTVWDSVRRAKTVNGIQFKPIDKLLYSYLLGWQVSKDDPNNKKVTKVNSSVRELQQELGVSKGTIETSLKTLEKMGLIVIKSGGVGFSNEYDVRKFSEVESTNVEIKVDPFMEKRKEWREQHNQMVQTISSSMMIPSESMQSTNATDVNEQPEQKEPEIKTEPKTNWEVHQKALIAQNTKWDLLQDGQRMQVMVKVNSCMSSNFYAIKEAFNNEIARLTYQPETKKEDKPKPSYSIVPPAVQAINDAFNNDDLFGDSDDYPF